MQQRGCIIDRGRGRNFASERDFIGSGMQADISETTGDASLDKALGRALVRISQEFGETPGFGFIDDGVNGNAFASPEIVVPGTWGTVMFGRTLFRDLMDRYSDGIAVIAVAAHEFGHIAQFRSGIDSQLLVGQQNVRRVELHADFISGYFLGRRKADNPNLRLWSAGETLYRIGDYAFNDRNHHGTPDERTTAAEAGFAYANDHSNFGQAFRYGAEYILRKF